MIQDQYVYPPPMMPAVGISSFSSAPQSASTLNGPYENTIAPNSSSSCNELIQVLNSTSSSPQITESVTRELYEQGYTNGLINAFVEAKKSLPLRIWIIDNSGSMRLTDGTKLIAQKNQTLRLIRGCSRWSEMQQTVEYHAKIAASIEAPTIFRLLNDPGISAGPQEFSVAVNGLDRQTIDNDLQVTLSTMSKAQPSGVTPLVDHVNYIRGIVQSLESHLRSTGTKIAIIIGTDGLPSDLQGISSDSVKQQFEHSLRTLEGLPVWIVVRLFTDDNDVVEFWNDIDSKLELSIEVIDDFSSEAIEMHKTNGWLNYGLPLHRLREFGFSNYLFDLLDEKKLSKGEIRDFCRLLFGHGLLDEAPDADVNWKGFLTVLDKANADPSIPKQWNPVTQKVAPWIDTKALRRLYPTENDGCRCM